jgi:hypothetical protein
VAEAGYNPTYVRKQRHGGYCLDDSPSAPLHKYRVEVDALFHYFVNDDEEGDACVDGDCDLTQGEAIAKLITRKYHSGIYLHDTAMEHEAPLWTRFRDEATFISGDIIAHAEGSIVRWLYHYHGENLLVLDASKYDNDYAKGVPVPAFERLMYLANNTQSVIEEGVIQLYPNHTRAAIEFINAAPYQRFEDNPHNDTKWLAEGRILSNELIKIPEFQQNFNLLVITGAARYIQSNQLNLNSLYRLFAKLGRVNTRLVFLG